MREDKKALWEDYTSSRFKGRGSHSHFPNWFKRIEGPLLDVGCGIGEFLNVNQSEFKIGLEISWWALQEAKRKFGLEHLVRASGTQLPFKEEAFKSVVLIEVIEHVKDLDSLLQEARRVLKRGGKLFIKTPNYPFKRLYDIKRRSIQSGKFVIPPDDPTHFNPLSLRKLVKHLRKYFEVLWVDPYEIFFERHVPRTCLLYTSPSPRDRG